MPYSRHAYYYETDKMGIVHHSNYVRILEEARVDLLNKLDMPFTEIEARGLMIPVLSVSLEYKFPLRFDDEFEVRCRAEEFNGCKFTISYEVFDLTSGKVSLTAQTRHCFTDENLMPVRLKKKQPDIYEKFMSYYLSGKEKEK